MLCHLAFKDIEAKLSEENIITETFSGFAAQYVSSRTCISQRILSLDRHPEIMTIECKHLSEELRTERTITSALELIKGMEGGDAAHRANALKLGLYNALRQKDPAKSTLAKLRCIKKTCRANEHPISYHDLGGKAGCPGSHVVQTTMVCSECGSARVDYSRLCNGCRRLFE